MALRLKKLADQVIAITGATSGIGLTTARMAAEKGARLVLAARSQDARDRLASELRKQGTQVLTVTADVGHLGDVARIVQSAVERFGHIDTWVNNAGISIFGRNEDVPLEDQQRLFQTNFWGVVHGSLEAVKQMKRQGGGALINVGSETSDRAVPLQGMVSASKHAVKGFTDSLRMELEREGAPISVTLVKPAAIDTLLTVHAKNFMGKEPALAKPVYAPELAADAILYAARHPRRDVFVGAAAKMMSVGGFHMPRMLDRYMRAFMFRAQRSEQLSAPGRRDALYAPDPASQLRQRQGMSEKVVESCPYTALAMRSKAVMTTLIGTSALLMAWRLARRSAR